MSKKDRIPPVAIFHTDLITAIIIIINTLIIKVLFVFLLVIYFSNLIFTIMSRVFCFLVIVSLLGFGSCKKKSADPDFCATSWATQLSDEVNALSAAAQTYATNPTTENCNAYKGAYQSYLNALEPFADCAAWTVEQKNELQAAIDQAQAEINTLCQ